MPAPLNDRVVLVTGANGGLGEQFVGQALERDARRVYAAARSPRAWTDERVVPLTLDLTDAATVARAVELAGDVDLLVNNAAIAPADDRSIATGDEAVLRQIFETNFFGTLRVAKAFAPVLGANGGGGLLNILSLSSWLPIPTAYAASKAAMLSATNALRLELRSQKTTVTAVLVGMIDTPMSSRWDVPKVTPADVVAQSYDGVVAGAFEVHADADTRMVKTLLAASSEDFHAALEEPLSAFVP